jgi:hypothetical protein
MENKNYRIQKNRDVVKHLSQNTLNSPLSIKHFAYNVFTPPPPPSSNSLYFRQLHTLSEPKFSEFRNFQNFQFHTQNGDIL